MAQEYIEELTARIIRLEDALQIGTCPPIDGCHPHKDIEEADKHTPRLHATVGEHSDGGRDPLTDLATQTEDVEVQKLKPRYILNTGQATDPNEWSIVLDDNGSDFHLQFWDINAGMWVTVCTWNKNGYMQPAGGVFVSGTNGVGISGDPPCYTWIRTADGDVWQMCALASGLQVSVQPGGVGGFLPRTTIPRGGWAKGDLQAGDGSGALIKLAVGPSGYGLASDPVAPTGLSWKVFDVVGAQIPGILPIGAVTAYAGQADPGLQFDGGVYLICEGRQLLDADYPDLFAVIGYAFGGSGGTFNIPDLRDRFPLGASRRLVGEVGGGWNHDHGQTLLEHTHLATSPAHGHVVDSHTHTITIPAHSHDPGTLAVAAHVHGAGTLAAPAHTHPAGTLAAPSHDHGVGTYSAADHTHGAGSLSVGDHQHGSGSLQAADHQHGAGSLSVASHDHNLDGVTFTETQPRHTHPAGGYTVTIGTHDHTTNIATRQVDAGSSFGALVGTGGGSPTYNLPSSEANQGAVGVGGDSGTGEYVTGDTDPGQTTSLASPGLTGDVAGSGAISVSGATDVGGAQAVSGTTAGSGGVAISGRSESGGGGAVGGDTASAGGGAVTGETASAGGGAITGLTGSVAGGSGNSGATSPGTDQVAVTVTVESAGAAGARTEIVSHEPPVLGMHFVIRAK